jgi:hypothetical protein
MRIGRLAAAQWPGPHAPGALVAILLGPQESGRLGIGHAFKEIEAAIIGRRMRLAEPVAPFAAWARRRMGSLKITTRLLAHACTLGPCARRLVGGGLHAYIRELHSVSERFAV